MGLPQMLLFKQFVFVKNVVCTIEAQLYHKIVLSKLDGVAPFVTDPPCAKSTQSRKMLGSLDRGSPIFTAPPAKKCLIYQIALYNDNGQFRI